MATELDDLLDILPEDQLSDADKAYRVIKERIVTLQMAPGSVINQNELMLDLELGRTPIRDALRQLETESLVTAVPRRGMSVTEITLTDLRHIFEIRYSLEGACAEYAAERASDAQILALRHTLAELKATDPADKETIVNLERRFHAMLARCSDSFFLQNEAVHYYNLGVRIWHLLMDRLPPGSADVPTHEQTVDAIAGRDGKRARQLMEGHVAHFFEMVKQHL